MQCSMQCSTMAALHFLLPTGHSQSGRRSFDSKLISLPPLDEAPVHVHRFAARAPCDSKGSECQCGIQTGEAASALRSRKTERAAKEKPTPISHFFLAPAAPRALATPLETPEEGDPYPRTLHLRRTRLEPRARSWSAVLAHKLGSNLGAPRINRRGAVRILGANFAGQVLQMPRRTARAVMSVLGEKYRRGRRRGSRVETCR